VDFTESDQIGRRLAQYIGSELEKIAQGVGVPSAGASTAPAGELEGTVRRASEGVSEGSPAHGIVAARVEQLGDKKARGIPVIQPPPGFVFAPELQAFKPEVENPGWMDAEQAGEAARAKAFFEQGARAAQQQQAQQEMDAQVAQQSAIAVQEQQGAQAQQALQQQATQAATLKAVAKQQASETAASLRAPRSITGQGDRPRQKRNAKGVTIRIGK